MIFIFNLQQTNTQVYYPLNSSPMQQPRKTAAQKQPSCKRRYSPMQKGQGEKSCEIQVAVSGKI